MKNTRFISLLIATIGLCLTAKAQTSETVQTILPGTSKVSLTWDGQTVSIPVRANNNFSIMPNKTWLKAELSANSKMLIIKADTTYSDRPRTANIVLKTADGAMSRTIEVTQEEEKFYETILDKQIAPKLYSASSAQTGQGIERLFDGNTSTQWSSIFGVSEEKPAVITIYFSGKDPISYMVYTPRQSYSTSGFWKTYKITATDHGKTYTQTWCHKRGNRQTDQPVLQTCSKRHL